MDECLKILGCYSKLLLHSQSHWTWHLASNGQIRKIVEDAFWERESTFLWKNHYIFIFPKVGNFLSIRRSFGLGYKNHFRIFSTESRSALPISKEFKTFELCLFPRNLSIFSLSFYGKLALIHRNVSKKIKSCFFSELLKLVSDWTLSDIGLFLAERTVRPTLKIHFQEVKSIDKHSIEYLPSAEISEKNHFFFGKADVLSKKPQVLIISRNFTIPVAALEKCYISTNYIQKRERTWSWVWTQSAVIG